MSWPKRRKTLTVRIGPVSIGGHHPIAIQSMTNTPTSDINATFRQIKELIANDSDMVRITINNKDAALAVIKIIERLKSEGLQTPIIGDFHYNGHILLEQYPRMAALLSKYRINPGNLGGGRNHDENFSKIISVAIANKKPIRIGVNGGSIDRDLLKEKINRNRRLLSPKSIPDIITDALIDSALKSAQRAIKLGLKNNMIVLSIKASDIRTLIKVNMILARKCVFPLHLGLTEAGAGIQGVASSSAALALLLERGIGDTIRVSLTPSTNSSRCEEVDVCKSLLQSLGLRYFEPTVISCPGCGRTQSNVFQNLAQEVKNHIRLRRQRWKKLYPGFEKITIAVMGCVVNGPGESKHADIGISLPGTSERTAAPIFINGVKVKTLTGDNIHNEFIALLDNYIKKRFRK